MSITKWPRIPESDIGFSRLEGVTAKESYYGAVLKVGKSVGARMRRWVGWRPPKERSRVGYSLSTFCSILGVSDGKILRLLTEKRRAQIGDNVGWTVRPGKGEYRDEQEKSSEVVIDWFKTPGEIDPIAFEAHISALAQEMAYALAQEEIIIVFKRGGEEIRARASPSGMPMPGDELDRFLDNGPKAQRWEK